MNSTRVYVYSDDISAALSSAEAQRVLFSGGVDPLSKNACGTLRTAD